MSTLLAADIGGTKSELAIVALESTPDVPPLQHKRYRNSAFPGFDALLEDFLKNSPIPEYGCFGVAAVVHNGVAPLTNLDWVLDEKKLCNKFAFQEITLINDLTAICAGLPLLKEQDLLCLQQVEKSADGIQAVIAPGTGLGEGFLLTGENCFFPQGSEGGHCDFAPLNKEQEQLLEFMRKKFGAVSYELLCSGLGIPNIFDFFATTDIPRRSTVFADIEQAADRTPPIVSGALAQTPCPLCQKTLSVFLEILGAESGNLALKTYCSGGLFIGGGILPRIASDVSFAPFLKAFRKKEKMEKLMASIPVHIILKKDAALLGCIHFGRHLYHTGTQ
ncbi:MAG: glucokinase [Desulfocapsa sp.]|nr:MAG: glucokinase [Desulfocapsa sp.]